MNAEWGVGSGEWGEKSQKIFTSDFVIPASNRIFTIQNLWRMKQFYETYGEREKLSPLVRELPWSNNLLILGKTKSDEEKEFYLRLAIKER